MKTIERMRSWYDREYVEIVRRQKRPAYLFLAYGWFFFFIAVCSIIDFFDLYGLMTTPIIVMSDLLQDLGIIHDLFVIVSVIWFAIWIFVWCLGPFVVLMVRSARILDKEFVGDPERTEKWRKKWGKKDD